MFTPTTILLLGTFAVLQITWVMTSEVSEPEMEAYEQELMNALLDGMRVSPQELDDPEAFKKHFAEHMAKRFSEFIGGKRKRFSEFLGGKKRFSEFLGGKKRFSEFLGGKKRFSEFLGGKKRFSEFLGGKKRFSEFLGGKKRFSEFLGGKRNAMSNNEMPNRNLEFLGER